MKKTLLQRLTKKKKNDQPKHKKTDMKNDELTTGPHIKISSDLLKIVFHAKHEQCSQSSPFDHQLNLAGFSTTP